MLAYVDHDGRFRQTTGSELRLLQNRQATRLTTQVDAAPSPVHAGNGLAVAPASARWLILLARLFSAFAVGLARSP